MVEAGLFVDGGGAEPALSRRIEVGASSLPRAGGRRAHEVDRNAVPHCRRIAAVERAAQLDQLVASANAVAQRFSNVVGDRLHVYRAEPPRMTPAPPLLPAATDPVGKEPEVAGGDDVDGRAHQRRLHRPAPLQRACEIRELEAAET
jgi:hypothetical protein